MREIQRVDTRVLGALRFVDAGTGSDIVTPLQVRALEGSARFVRNRSGLQVIAQWSVLAAHEAEFAEPPATPAVASQRLPIVVRDATGRYLPRRLSVALPRDPDAGHAADAGSLFRPLVVPMYPASASATGANWSVLRAT
ncbi:MAG TPA: hypothetical protein VF832_00820, partial [Longimicrobiales bacterium]